VNRIKPNGIHAVKEFLQNLEMNLVFGRITTAIGISLFPLEDHS